MNPADMAKANAISLEVKKDGLTQKQSGDWQLRFTVAHTDMSSKLAEAPMGTRFACVLVEIGDDETPIDHKAKERDKWRDLGPTKQSAIRCQEPVFWAFLTEHMFGNALPITTEEMAAKVVREHCGISSRSDLDKPGNSVARSLWHELDMEFQGWKVKERVI